MEDSRRWAVVVDVGPNPWVPYEQGKVLASLIEEGDLERAYACLFILICQYIDLASFSNFGIKCFNLKLEQDDFLINALSLSFDYIMASF